MVFTHHPQSDTGALRACATAPTPLLVRQAARTIMQFDMLAQGERVLVGVSGGPDSVALLHVLLVLKPRLQLTLAVVHVNHGLRAAAEREVDQVKTLSEKHSLRLHLTTLDLGDRSGSLEERARDARHAVFEQLAERYEYARIALGHQADDNAEAVLMNLLRGSGPRGLAGIPPVRQRIIRPLIGIRRVQILAYLHEHAIPYAHDESNEDRRFTRNRIRHELIPLLEQHYNPQVVRLLNRTADLCRDEECFWREYLRPLVGQAQISADKKQLDVPIDLLMPQNRPVRRRLLREVLRYWRGDLRRIGAGHIDSLIGTLLANPKGASLRLPNAIRVERDGAWLRFTQALSRPDPLEARQPCFDHIIASAQALPLSLDIPASGDRIAFRIVAPPAPAALVREEPDCTWFDLDRISFPLHVRFVKPGDRLQPFGMVGHQKVKTLLSDRKIPREQRRSIPALLGGDTLLWVVGVRRASAAPVCSNTLRALQVVRLPQAARQAFPGFGQPQ
jgi:tRNA(Ile)-lysidine synthase